MAELPANHNQAVALSRVQLAPGWIPVVRSWGDLNYWTTTEQARLFKNYLESFGSATRWFNAISPHTRDLRNEPDIDVQAWISGQGAHSGWFGGRIHWGHIRRALDNGAAAIPLDKLVLIASRANDKGSVYTSKGAGWLSRHIYGRLTLEKANLELAGYKVALARNANASNVVNAAQAFKIRTDISVEDMGGAVAFEIADAATSQGLTITQAVELYGDGVQGAGSILSEFFNDAKDWFNDAVVKNIGRGFAWVGEQILAARDNVPYLGTFFLDPLGISLLAESLRQVGEYFRTGDAAASFNERVLGFELGRHWTALGQALIVAGGIIGQTGIGLPFGVIITAIGVLLYAAGATIIGEMEAREAASRKRAAQKELDAMNEQLASECRAELVALGVPDDQIPRDADKCVKAYEGFQEEILSSSKPAPRKRSSGLGWLLTALGVGYLLTRK